jgi:hypothetical protein
MIFGSHVHYIEFGLLYVDLRLTYNFIMIIFVSKMLNTKEIVSLDFGPHQALGRYM